ncbi:MAG TPA: methyltransferase domain-containing protein [Nitrospirota bacterium]|nr:methyltransferase domain-containing protein [Nitrospirota bacterium]
MTIILQCPVCRNPLLNSADGYRCSKNHTFDAAREGYVNVLLSHKKNSKEPGDSKEMIRSRRRFLDLGLYDGISSDINEAVADNLPESRSQSAFNILDAGCGEGFYLKRLKEFLAHRPGAPVTHEYYGVDISKSAIRQATQRDRTMGWFVASIVDLPFAQASFDMVLNVFSPADFHEFSRVLRKTGGLLVVSPGPRHLNGLREIIYPETREHAPSTICEEVKGLFSLSTETRINYQLELKSRAAIMDLLAMTPYFWNIDLKTKAKVEALDRLALDVDVELRVFNKSTG